MVVAAVKRHTVLLLIQQIVVNKPCELPAVLDTSVLPRSLLVCQESYSLCKGKISVLMYFIVCSANMQLEVGLSFWMQDASTPELEFCW